MKNNERLKPQTTEWYNQLTTLQDGYYYPWRSQVGIWDGEAQFLPLVQAHLHSDADVLDVACGHGSTTLSLAPLCRSIVGYDYTAPWIELAQQNARESGITNATFICHDSSAAANDGQARLPSEADSYDLLICSKGPFHWIEDAPRVARNGAVMLMLVPDADPLTAWHSLLPDVLQWQDAPDHWARPAIEQRLALAELRLDSWWSFDVPEAFSEPEQLYIWLTFGQVPEDVPSFAEVRPILGKIFTKYANSHGVEIRRRRYLWKAIVNKH